MYPSGGGLYLTYVSVTVRIPHQVALQVREIAKVSGWQLADYLRTAICIGATFFLLLYGSKASQEAATGLLGGMKPLKFSRSFSLSFSERPYAFRHHFHKSTLTTISLPKSFCNLIATYAGLMKVSRNEVYNICLQQGLLIYLKAQITVLHASQK